MKIKFTENVTIPAGKDPELRFKNGSVHDLCESSAWRWVRRDKAVWYVAKVFSPKLGRPMMGDVQKLRDEMAKVDLVGLGKMAAEIDKPKKRGRPKKGV